MHKIQNCQDSLKTFLLLIFLLLTVNLGLFKLPARPLDIFSKSNQHMHQTTVASDNINIMKTTFELIFDFYQAFKQHGYTKIWKQREAVN